MPVIDDSRSIPFIKMHGAENDYVFIDGFATVLPQDGSNLARFVSRRRASVGADGLVFLVPPTDDQADVEMRIWNADGSSAEMCGTAARCVAVWMQREGRVRNECRIRMGDRLITAAGIRSDGSDDEATVNVGSAVVLSPLIGDRVSYGATPTQFVTVYQVDVGNPHAVVFAPELTDALVSELGPTIECHSDFPNRTNVEFVVVESSEALNVRVWERGSGETRSCGSGACAAAAAAWATGRLTNDRTCCVRMPGGPLTIRRDSDGSIWLSGPVFVSHTGVLRI